MENIPLATIPGSVRWVLLKISPFSLLNSKKQQYFMLAPPYPNILSLLPFLISLSFLSLLCFDMGAILKLVVKFNLHIAPYDLQSLQFSVLVDDKLMNQHESNSFIWL